MFAKSSQTALKVWLVAAIAAAAVTNYPELWALDIAKVMQGQWWRLASGHLVHLSWQHYGYDLPTLGLALYLCSRLEDEFNTIAVSVLFSAAATSATLLVLHPVDIYGGVSGITAGLLTFVAVRMIVDREAQISGVVLLVAMLFKICLERRGISASGVAPVWQAHCAGAAAGAFVSVLSLKQNYRIISNREARRTL
jgi:rhomboid family GlyGly-CTERM serine protease